MLVRVLLRCVCEPERGQAAEHPSEWAALSHSTDTGLLSLPPVIARHEAPLCNRLPSMILKQNRKAMRVESMNDDPLCQKPSVAQGTEGQCLCHRVYTN